ncbi:hypothetical protein [uncultured Dokdonia sp.]|uniref:hypothetical protein n=1 Tax=uncultured Dokdonia sp. TaxID=575653 RepID=UPI00261C38BF|nr:hypothetical protein [uncultured Dokdonia sp.]
MIKKLLLSYFICLCTISAIIGQSKNDYTVYHQSVLQIEQKIVSEKYGDALSMYEQLFNSYDFVFIRDYKIASQLAAYTKNKEKTLAYIELAIQSGWTLKAIKKNKLFKEYLTKEDWKTLKNKYDSLVAIYEDTLNKEVQSQVKKMFAKDQWKAFKALFRFSEKAQTRYTENKFAPHSEQQIAKLMDIIAIQGYPGEQLVGKGYWTSTIISHHNSISTSYNRKDTLYPPLIPILKEAIKKGQLSPYQFVIIDDWYLTSLNDDSKPTYGIIKPLPPEHIAKTNNPRTTIGIRTIPLRDSLLTVEEKTGIRLYITDIW